MDQNYGLPNYNFSHGDNSRGIYTSYDDTYNQPNNYTCDSGQNDPQYRYNDYDYNDSRISDADYQQRSTYVDNPMYYKYQQQNRTSSYNNIVPPYVSQLNSLKRSYPGDGNDEHNFRGSSLQGQKYDNKLQGQKYDNNLQEQKFTNNLQEQKFTNNLQGQKFTNNLQGQKFTNNTQKEGILGDIPLNLSRHTQPLISTSESQKPIVCRVCTMNFDTIEKYQVHADSMVHINNAALAAENALTNQKAPLIKTQNLLPNQKSLFGPVQNVDKRNSSDMQMNAFSNQRSNNFTDYMPNFIQSSNDTTSRMSFPNDWTNPNSSYNDRTNRRSSSNDRITNRNSMNKGITFFNNKNKPWITKNSNFTSANNHSERHGRTANRTSPLLGQEPHHRGNRRMMSTQSKKINQERPKTETNKCNEGTWRSIPQHDPQHDIKYSNLKAEAASSKPDSSSNLCRNKSPEEELTEKASFDEDAMDFESEFYQNIQLSFLPTCSSMDQIDNQLRSSIDQIDNQLSSSIDQIDNQSGSSIDQIDCQSEFSNEVKGLDNQEIQESVATEDADKDVPIGQEFVIPVSGFFCKLCRKFYNKESMAKVDHCKSEDHIARYKAQKKTP